jgi:hypothetical protein
MMHAIEISANGGPEVMEYVDRPVPEPGPRQRLRKLEQYTARALSDPRAAAELCIALETARRAPSAN